MLVNACDSRLGRALGLRARRHYAPAAVMRSRMTRSNSSVVPSEPRDERLERVAVHREQRRLRLRLHRRDPRGVAEDRDLAEVVAGAERVDRLLLAAVLADHVDLALDDDEELVRRRALADDHRARLDLHRLQAPGHRREVARGQVAEDAVDRVARVVDADLLVAAVAALAALDELDVARRDAEEGHVGRLPALERGELLGEELDRARDLVRTKDHLRLTGRLNPPRLAPVLRVLVDRERDDRVLREVPRGGRLRVQPDVDGDAVVRVRQRRRARDAGRGRRRERERLVLAEVVEDTLGNLGLLGGVTHRCLSSRSSVGAGGHSLCQRGPWGKSARHAGFAGENGLCSPLCERVRGDD